MSWEDVGGDLDSGHGERETVPNSEAEKPAGMATDRVRGLGPHGLLRAHMEPSQIRQHHDQLGSPVPGCR